MKKRLLMSLMVTVITVFSVGSVTYSSATEPPIPSAGACVCCGYYVPIPVIPINEPPDALPDR